MIRRLLARFGNDGTVLKGAVILGSGAAVGQGVLLLATPILSRLYAPAEIGHFALYLSFVSVAVTVAPLGYQRAIPTTESKSEAAHLAAGVLLIQPVMCLLLAALQWTLIASERLGFGDLAPYTVLLSGFSIFANTLLMTLQFWFIRSESYPVISRVQVQQYVARASLQVGLGAAGISLLGLIVGDFGGRLLGLTGMTRQVWRDLREEILPLRLNRFLTVFRKYRKFLFPQLPSIVINTVARMLPVPLLVYYHGAEAAGLYAMVDRVLQVPVAFVSKSFGDAFHGRISRYARTAPHEIQALFLKSSAGLLAVGIIPALVLVFWGRPLFAVVLGERWAEAGAIAALVAPWALSALVVATVSRVVYVYQAFATAFWYNLLSLAVVLVVFVLASRGDWDLMRTITWLSRLGLAAYAVYYLLLLRIVHREARLPGSAAGGGQVS